MRITPTGTITAVGVGETTIKGTDKGGNIQNITITVSSPAEKMVFIKAGKSKTVKFYNVISGKATWETSDSNITGHIAAGKVNGLYSGSATILCKYNPYNTTNPIEYKAKVFVEDPSIIIHDDKGLYTKNAKTSGTLRVSMGDVSVFEVSNVYQSVKYVSSNPRVVFVDESGVMYAENLGSATVTAKINGVTLNVNFL